MNDTRKKAITKLVLSKLPIISYTERQVVHASDLSRS